MRNFQRISFVTICLVCVAVIMAAAGGCSGGSKSEIGYWQGAEGIELLLYSNKTGIAYVPMTDVDGDATDPDECDVKWKKADSSEYEEKYVIIFPEPPKNPTSSDFGKLFCYFYESIGLLQDGTGTWWMNVVFNFEMKLTSGDTEVSSQDEENWIQVEKIR